MPHGINPQQLQRTFQKGRQSLSWFCTANPGLPSHPELRCRPPQESTSPVGPPQPPLPYLPRPLSSFSSPLIAPPSRLLLSLLQSSTHMSFITEMSLLQAENLPPHQTSLSSIPALFFSIILFTTSQTLFSLLPVGLHTLDHELHQS